MGVSKDSRSDHAEDGIPPEYDVRAARVAGDQQNPRYQGKMPMNSHCPNRRNRRPRRSEVRRYSLRVPLELPGWSMLASSQYGGFHIDMYD